MPTFSKFITSQRGAQQILDSYGYIYSRKKSSDTALTSTWRCAKYNPPTKCKCHIYLALADNSLTLGTQPHNHSADGSVPARQEVLLSLKRKAVDQPLSQKEVDQLLFVLGRGGLPVVLERSHQQSGCGAGGRSAEHAEATTSEDFILPSTCTRRNEPFVLYDGKTDRGLLDIPQQDRLCFCCSQVLWQ
ncbi:hypothetical protein ACHWQZ_G018779 [Mnemiopsis leidyi]